MELQHELAEEGMSDQPDAECECRICPEHFNQHLAERVAAAQLAATHVAIRALPRVQWPTIFLETDYVLWQDVARLIGDDQ
jgi:hypothetical protein